MDTSSIFKISCLDGAASKIYYYTNDRLSHRFRRSKRPRGPARQQSPKKARAQGRGKSAVPFLFPLVDTRALIPIKIQPPHLAVKTSGFEIILVIVPLDRHPAPPIMIIAMIIKGNWSRAAGTRLEAARCTRQMQSPFSKRRCSCTCSCRCPSRYMLVILVDIFFSIVEIVQCVALFFSKEKSINGYLLMSDRSTKEKVRNRE